MLAHRVYHNGSAVVGDGRLLFDFRLWVENFRNLIILSGRCLFPYLAFISSPYKVSDDYDVAADEVIVVVAFELG